MTVILGIVLTVFGLCGLGAWALYAIGEYTDGFLDGEG